MAAPVPTCHGLSRFGQETLLPPDDHPCAWLHGSTRGLGSRGRPVHLASGRGMGEPRPPPWRGVDLRAEARPGSKRGNVNAAIEVVEVEGALRAWRVLGLAKVFTDRKPGEVWSHVVEDRPREGDRRTVFMGDIPPHVIDGVRSFHAHGIFILHSLIGNAYADKTPDDVQQLIHEFAYGADDAESALRGDFKNWLTLEVARPMLFRVASSGSPGCSSPLRPTPRQRSASAESWQQRRLLRWPSGPFGLDGSLSSNRARCGGICAPRKRSPS